MKKLLRLSRLIKIAIIFTFLLTLKVNISLSAVDIWENKEKKNNINKDQETIIINSPIILEDEEETSGDISEQKISDQTEKLIGIIDPEENDFNLSMDGRSIFEFMMRRIPTDIDTCLEINGFSLGEIDYFIFHQASLHMLKSLQNAIKIPDDKMIFYIKNTGNTVSSSIPLALQNLLLTKNIKNKIVLLSGFGVGLSWGSVIIKFN